MITYDSPRLMIYQEPNNYVAPAGTLYVYFGAQTFALFPGGKVDVAEFNDRNSIVDLNEDGNEPEETMNDLERLIADSIETRNHNHSAAAAGRLAEEARYEALFHSIIGGTIERVKPEIPAALHPYIKFSGAQPSNRYMLDARTWTPPHLDINAPGLATLTLAIGADDDDKTVVWNISVEGSTSTFSDQEWAEAIAAAFDRYHERRREYSEAARGL